MKLLGDVLEHPASFRSHVHAFVIDVFSPKEPQSAALQNDFYGRDVIAEMHCAEWPEGLITA